MIVFISSVHNAHKIKSTLSNCKLHTDFTILLQNVLKLHAHTKTGTKDFHCFQCHPQHARFVTTRFHTTASHHLPLAPSVLSLALVLATGTTATDTGTIATVTTSCTKGITIAAHHLPLPPVPSASGTNEGASVGGRASNREATNTAGARDDGDDNDDDDDDDDDDGRGGVDE
jgi:hypothetical protein